MVKYQVVTTDVLTNVAVVIDGELYVSDSVSNPRFQEILNHLLRDETPPVYLFDLTAMVSDRFENLSERVSVRGNQVYFDGDVLDNSLTQHIARLVEEDVVDWRPLVLFLENLSQNPEQDSREQLYNWLRPRNFTITEDGSFLAYKGVRSTDEDGVYKSINSGTAVVDGTLYENTEIPNFVGAVVTMPRSEVEHDPNTACSVGLHAGTHGYATSFASHLLTVKINPRDVVSVPRDSSGEKLRVCRYEVLEVNDTKVEYDEPVWIWGDEDDFEDEDQSDQSSWGYVSPTYVVTSTATTATGSSTGPHLTVNSQAKLGWDEVDKIREAHKLGYSVKWLSENYDVSERTIQRIVANQAWVR